MSIKIVTPTIFSFAPLQDSSGSVRLTGPLKYRMSGTPCPNKLIRCLTNTVTPLLS